MHVASIFLSVSTLTPTLQLGLVQPALRQLWSARSAGRSSRPFAHIISMMGKLDLQRCSSFTPTLLLGSLHNSSPTYTVSTSTAILVCTPALWKDRARRTTGRETRGTMGHLPDCSCFPHIQTRFSFPTLHMPGAE